MREKFKLLKMAFMTSQLPTLSHLSSAFSHSIFAHIIQHGHINYFHVNESAMNSYTFLTLHILISSAWRDSLIPQVSQPVLIHLHLCTEILQNVTVLPILTLCHTCLFLTRFPRYTGSSLEAASVPYLPFYSYHQPNDYNSVDVKTFAELINE